MLEQLAFNAQQIRGSRDPGHAPFEKNCKGLFLDCPWEYACQMWSPVSLTELEQLNNASLMYPLTSGVYDLKHARILGADNFNICCNIVNCKYACQI